MSLYIITIIVTITIITLTTFIITIIIIIIINITLLGDRNAMCRKDPRPVLAGSGIKRFGLDRFGRFGSVSYSFPKVICGT